MIIVVSFWGPGSEILVASDGHRDEHAVIGADGQLGGRIQTPLSNSIYRFLKILNNKNFYKFWIFIEDFAYYFILIELSSRIGGGALSSKASFANLCEVEV